MSGWFFLITSARATFAAAVSSLKVFRFSESCSFILHISFACSTVGARYEEALPRKTIQLGRGVIPPLFKSLGVDKASFPVSSTILACA